jgi:mannose-6-phosphate isomerase-like protein (cupin superfamily)
VAAVIVRRVDVTEAPVELTEHGLVCKGDGWFVVNARELRWYVSEGWGKFSNFGGDTLFEQLGFGLAVLGPGEPLSMYHWETDQEDFLVLSGAATLIIEGQERPLRQWDLVHCPPYAQHTIVGGPCVILGVGSRERHTEIGPDGRRRGRDDGSAYTVNATAIRYGAGIEPGTAQDEAYARFPPRTPVRYGGWLDDLLSASARRA